MSWFWKKRVKLGDERGFTLIELMIVVAIIGILVSIAVPLYASVQSRARVAKAQADVRGLASAVSVYSAHMGVLPAALTDLTAVATNPAGITAGPFMAAVPTVPATNWTPQPDYSYVPNTATGLFVISAVGDGETVSGP
jgi:type IV pilus assembly protein PilA